MLHCLSGVVALTACVLIGPRQDQYVTRSGLVNKQRRSSIALQVRGTLLLWVAFIALNAVLTAPSITAQPELANQVRRSWR